MKSYIYIRGKDVVSIFGLLIFFTVTASVPASNEIAFDIVDDDEDELVLLFPLNFKME